MLINFKNTFYISFILIQYTVLTTSISVISARTDDGDVVMNGPFDMAEFVVLQIYVLSTTKFRVRA